MNYSEIVNIVENSDEVNVHFCFRNSNNEYITLIPSLSGEVTDNIIDIITENLAYYESKTHSPYNPVSSIDGTVEISSITDYPVVNNLLNVIDQPQNGDVTPEDVEFLIYEVKKDNSRVFFLRRHNRLKSFRKKGFIVNFREGHFNVLDESKFIGIDDKIDLMIKENEIIIFYHTAFERIFNLNEGFLELATTFIEQDIFRNQISNFEQLRDDLLDNKTQVKRLAKINQDTAYLFLENTEKTEEVIADFSLDIDFDEDSKLVYRSKDQLNSFVNFMQDAYYRTLIGDGKGIDERR